MSVEQKSYVMKRAGRPLANFVDEKPCKNCGKLFTMADIGVKFPSRFVNYSCCSQECRDAISCKATDVDYLYSKVEIDEATGCHNFQGCLTSKGYGRIKYKQRTVRAHRLSYMFAKGPIPDGMMVLHSCDNPRCINPDHLRVGTARDNWNDCVSRGRTPRSNAIITDPWEVANCKGGIDEVAALYGVGRTTVYRYRQKFLSEKDPRQSNKRRAISTDGDAGVSSPGVVDKETPAT